MDQNPQRVPVPDMLASQPDKLARRATQSLVLGIIGMVAWFIPIIGLPVQIVGLVFGVKAKNSTKSGRASAGIVLCIIGLVLSVANASIGAYLGATGQSPVVNKIMNK
jgi:hypothetical protein